MQKTKQLNKLFAQWKKEVDLFKREAFYADGIINEASFNQNPPGKKILFIAKEPNAGNYNDNQEKNFVKAWGGSNPPTYNFAQRIAEWTYGIIHDFPEYENINNKLTYLRKIAFMNVKKSGGGSFTDLKEMYTIVKPQCKFILKQIDIIEPDIIIACISFAGNLIEDIFSKVDFEKSGYNVAVGRYNNSRIINFYHPSSRNVPAAMYSLLQNVVQSEIFRKL